MGSVDFVLNIVLFVPVGFSVFLIRRRYSTAILIAATLTIVIETLQWRIVSGRDASVGDVLANTIGGAIGAWLASRMSTWVGATGANAFKLNVRLALIASFVLVVTSALLMPWVPREATFVQWRPVTQRSYPFSGRILFAEVNGVALTGPTWMRPTWSPDSLRRRFIVRAVLDPPTETDPRRATILRLANPLVEMLLLSQRGENLEFRNHTLGSRLRFRSPTVVLANAFRNARLSPSDSILVEANSNPRAMTLRSRQRYDSSEVTERQSVGLGWIVISPRDFPRTGVWSVLNAGWLGALAFPLGFLTRRSGNTDRGGAGLARNVFPVVLVVLASAAATLVFGLSAPALADIAGAGVGFLAGWVVAPLNSTISTGTIRS